jgi:quinate dehydrogenase (quinone)
MARSRLGFAGSLIFVLFVLVAWTLPARSQEANAVGNAVAKAEPSIAAKPGEWRYLNGDPLSTRYAPLDQIDKDNFKDLKIAWRWKPSIGPAPPSLDRAGQRRPDGCNLSQ